MKLATYAPKITVTVSDLATLEVKAVITDEVINITTTKAYQRCLGSWSITVIPKKNAAGLQYDQIITPNDHIQIAMSAGDDRPKVVVMTGLVNRVAISRHANGGQYQRTIHITGNDLGKMLMSEIGWDISPAKILVGENTEVSWQDRKAIMVGTPAFTINQIYNKVVAKSYPEVAKHILCDRIETADTWKVLQSAGYLADQTPIWQAMMHFENRPFNALWCDTDDAGKFHIGLEPYPLDGEGFVSRPSADVVAVEDWQIVGEDLGTSDEERVNLVTLDTPIYKYTTSNLAFPLSLTNKLLTNIDETSINLHGFKPHIIPTEFVPPSINEPTANTNVPNEAETRAQIFWNWYSVNHELEAGSMSIHGDPQIRAGMQLNHKNRNKSYLIEQVSHEFHIWPHISFTTSLELTRGRPTRG